MTAVLDVLRMTILLRKLKQHLIAAMPEITLRDALEHASGTGKPFWSMTISEVWEADVTTSESPGGGGYPGPQCETRESEKNLMEENAIRRLGARVRTKKHTYDQVKGEILRAMVGSQPAKMKDIRSKVEDSIGKVSDSTWEHCRKSLRDAGEIVRTGQSHLSMWSCAAEPALVPKAEKRVTIRPKKSAAEIRAEVDAVLLRTLYENGPMLKADIRKAMPSVLAHGVSRSIDRMRDAGNIKSIGKTNAAKWTLTAAGTRKARKNKA